MRSYVLSSDKKLPGLKSWLDPKYEGACSEFDYRVLRKKTVTLPKNWSRDFPDYVFKISRLRALKVKLNEAKSKIDKYYANDRRRMQYEHFKCDVRPHELLRGEMGIIAQQFEGEVVTNAWLKFYELAAEYLHPLLTSIKKKKRNREFRAFYAAEAPGAFILATNHFIKNHYPQIHWEWLANSYRMLEGNNDEPYVGDTYGLMQNYPKSWVYGADGDGDITSVANVRSLQNTLSEQMEGKKVHLFTADAKFQPDDMDYNEEENYNIPVQLGQIIFMASVLAKGGVTFLKMFTVLEPMTVSMLYILSSCFDKLMITKPITSKPVNSEIYVVGIGFKGLNSKYLDRLCNIMMFVRDRQNGKRKPSIFPKDQFDPDFIKQLVAIEKELIEDQIDYIDMIDDALCDPKNLGEATEATEELQIETATDWVKDTGIKKITSGQRLINV